MPAMRRGAAQGGILGIEQCAIALPSRAATLNGSDETPIETLSDLGFGGQYRLRNGWRLSRGA